MNVTVKVSMHGPFFQHGAAPVIAALHDGIQETVLQGEREIVKMAQPRPGGVLHSRSYAAAHRYTQTGHYARSIHGRMVSSMHGVINDSGVVYGPWLEGVSSRNQTTRFKGYAMFRKAKEKLHGLVGGILQKHVQKAMDRLR